MPVLIEQVGEVINRLFGPESTVQPVSIEANPVPLKETVAPLIARGGFKVKFPEIESTVRVAEAESPVLPVKVMTYGPGATKPTVKLPIGVLLPATTLQA